MKSNGLEHIFMCVFAGVSVETKPGKVRSGPGAAELSPPPLDVSVKNRDSQSCDAERCGNHGRCVTVKGELVCECEEGYSGGLCQNTSSSWTALALILSFLFGGALLTAMIMKKRFFNSSIQLMLIFLNHTLVRHTSLQYISAEESRRLGWMLLIKKYL